MKRTYEIEVDIMVRKTLIVTAETRDDARRIVEAAFVSGTWGNYLKYAQRGMAAPMPVEDPLTAPHVHKTRDVTKPEIGR